MDLTFTDVADLFDLEHYQRVVSFKNLIKEICDTNGSIPGAAWSMLMQDSNLKREVADLYIHSVHYHEKLQNCFSKTPCVFGLPVGTDATTWYAPAGTQRGTLIEKLDGGVDEDSNESNYDRAMKILDK